MYRARHADRQSEERPRYGLALDIKRVRRLGDRGRRDPDFLADRLQIGKRQAVLARHLSLGDLGPFRGGPEDGRHLLVVVSSLGHVSQVSSEASPEANHRGSESNWYATKKAAVPSPAIPSVPRAKAGATRRSSSAASS